jgi:ribonuclease P protein component
VERRRRIRRDADFRRVRQHGRCWSSDILVLCARAVPEAITRFGFVVSKRLGDAVVRNRIKRRLREAARRLAPVLSPGYDIVVIARGPIASRTSAELGEVLAGLAQRARLWRAPAPSVAMAAAAPAHSPPHPTGDATAGGQTR